jgi:hypothetical protein
MTWNDEARISCEFSFKCPKQWDRLQPTSLEGVRHCPECDRDVYLALSEEDFRRHADEGRCVAVRVFASNTLATAEPVYLVGSPGAPYGVRLRKS